LGCTFNQDFECYMCEAATKAGALVMEREIADC